MVFAGRQHAARRATEPIPPRDLLAAGVPVCHRRPAACHRPGVRNLQGVNEAVQRSSLARDLTLYLLARIGLVAVVAALLMLAKVPFLVALLVAIVIGMPLGMLIFRGLSARVTVGLAERGQRRAEERARLRAQLRGDVPEDVPGSDASGSSARGADTPGEERP